MCVCVYITTQMYNKPFILILPPENTTLSMFYTAVPWSRSFARASRFLKKSCLVGEGSIEGFSLVFSLYSDPLDLKSQHTDKVQVDLVLIVFIYFIYPNCFAFVKQLSFRPRKNFTPLISRLRTCVSKICNKHKENIFLMLYETIVTTVDVSVRYCVVTL